MEKILAYLDRMMPPDAVPVVNSLLAITAGFILYSLLKRAFRKLSAKGLMHSQLRVFVARIVKWLLIVVVVLLCLGFFGLSVGSLWATLSGILALVALGFVAVWSVLSNVLCSILLIIFQPFRIGDEIEIQEPTASFSVKGKVVTTNMLFTSLEVIDGPDNQVGSILRIPNNIFFQKYIRVIPGKRTETLQKYVARHQEHDQE